MKRHQQILAAILVVQVALIVIVFWPRPAVSGERTLLLPGLSSEVITSVVITDADDEQIVLRRVGTDWVLPEAGDYPVQADKVSAFLDRLLSLHTGRLVTRTEASHERLQVAAGDFQRRIDLEMIDGTTHRLYLGSSPRYGATHFRLDGQSETYLTDTLSAWEANAAAASWIDPVYLRVPEEDVTEMRLENGNGTFRFVRDRGVWRMTGLDLEEVLDETKLTELLQRLGSLQMTTPLGQEELPSYGLDRPSAVVTLETITETISLRIGAKDPQDNSYVVISSESPYFVRVAEYNVKSFVENQRDDFVLPPTPTPTPTP